MNCERMSLHDYASIIDTDRSHSEPKIGKIYKKSKRATKSDGGYSSGSSTSSMSTVINAARPFKRHYCCVECREHELKQMSNCVSHDYQNYLKKREENVVTDPYVYLLKSVMRGLRSQDERKLAKMQSRIEKLLRVEEKPLMVNLNDEQFEEKMDEFCREIEIRLRAIHDISEDVFRSVVKRLCKALHSTIRVYRFTDLMRSVRQFFS